MTTIEPIQILIIAFSLFALSRTYLRYKDNKISIGETIFWTFIWLSVITVAFIPQTITTLSAIFGLGRGLDLAISSSIIVLFYLIFKLYVKLEAIEQEITELVTKLALEKKHK